VDAFGLLRNDHRRARLVDQHAVGLVDDGEMQRRDQRLGRVAPHEAAYAGDAAGQQAVAGEPVLQVVEHQLLATDVADRMAVGGAALVRFHAAFDEAARQAEEFEQRPHLLAVAFGQVVVGADDVHARAAGGHDRGGQCGHQRLAFAGAHLRQAAADEDARARELHRMRPQPQPAARGLADAAERAGQRGRVARLGAQRRHRVMQLPGDLLLAGLAQGQRGDGGVQCVDARRRLAAHRQPARQVAQPALQLLAALVATLVAQRVGTAELGAGQRTDPTEVARHERHGATRSG
jgi:hypothetical protein